MQSSSSASWNKLPFQSNFKTDTTWRLKAVRLPIFVATAAPVLWLELRFFVACCLIPIIYLFAGETGNQWFYMLAGAIIAALFIGFFFPLVAILDTNAECSLPPTAVRDECVPLKVTLNRRGIFGPLSFFFPLKWLMIKVYLNVNNAKQSLLTPIVVDEVAGEINAFILTNPVQRGVYRLSAIELFSCFPFGMAWWSKKILIKYDPQIDETTNILTVYPKLGTMEANFLYRIRAATDSPAGLLTSRASSRAQTSSVKGIRDFVHGDSPRIVHWASSAKYGKLLVREFDTEGAPGFDVILNLQADWRSDQQFELAVAVTHSLIHLGHRVGIIPNFWVIPDLDAEAQRLPGFMADMPPVPAGLSRSSEILARVEPVDMDFADGLSMPNLGADAHQALLTVRPALVSNSNRAGADLGRDYDEEDDEHLDEEIYSVELAVIPRTHSAATGVIQNVHMPLHEQGGQNRRQGAGNPLGRVIAVIHDYEDIHLL
jgi:hypothetical protein